MGDYIGLIVALMPITISVPDRPDFTLRTHRLKKKKVKVSGWASEDPASVPTFPHGLRASAAASLPNIPQSSALSIRFPSTRPVRRLVSAAAHTMMIARRTVTFPSHRLTVTCAQTVHVARCRPGSLISLLHSAASSRSSSPVLRSLHCLCDRSDRLYNMSLWIYLTFNI